MREVETELEMKTRRILAFQNFLTAIFDNEEFQKPLKDWKIMSEHYQIFF